MEVIAFIIIPLIWLLLAIVVGVYVWRRTGRVLLGVIAVPLFVMLPYADMPIGKVIAKRLHHQLGYITVWDRVEVDGYLESSGTDAKYPGFYMYWPLMNRGYEYGELQYTQPVRVRTAGGADIVLGPGFYQFRRSNYDSETCAALGKSVPSGVYPYRFGQQNIECLVFTRSESPISRYSWSNWEVYPRSFLQALFNVEARCDVAREIEAGPEIARKCRVQHDTWFNLFGIMGITTTFPPSGVGEPFGVDDVLLVRRP